MANGAGAPFGWRAHIQAHRLLVFGSLISGFTLAVAAANLGRETAPFALVFVPAIAALLVAAEADGLHGVTMLFRRIAHWRAATRSLIRPMRSPPAWVSCRW